MSRAYTYLGKNIYKNSIDEINKRLKIEKNILHHHHPLNLFPFKFCLYVQFIQQYNHDHIQSDI